MPSVTKSGRDLYAPPLSTPLPEITQATPPLVQQMIRLLLAHQDSIAAANFQTLVLYREKGKQVCLKITKRLTI
jgi:hypothetical protein